MSKKKKLMFPMKCNKCGKEPVKDSNNGWDVVKLDCSCDGRIITDYTKHHYE